MNLESNMRKAEESMRFLGPSDPTTIGKILNRKPEPECGNCEKEKCQQCCTHDDRDHGCCLDCGHDNSGEENDYDYD